MDKIFDTIKEQFTGSTVGPMIIAGLSLSVLLPLGMLIVKKGFAWLWEGTKEGVNLVIHPGKVLGLAHRLRWVLHAVVQVLILVGLGFLNYHLDVIRYLDTSITLMRYIWLPLLYLILYLCVWALWLLRVVWRSEEVSPHADIDDAWREALQALENERIDVMQTPIFLVIGRTIEDEEVMFAGAQMELSVERTPRQADAPVHIYANENAIFVTCAGASLLGEHARLLAEELLGSQSAAEPESEPAPAPAPAAPEKPAEKAPPPAGGAAAAAAPTPATEPAAPTPAPALAEEQKPIREETPAAKPAPRIPLIKSRPEMERILRRLKHLCWLIKERRKPYCPINGVLLVIPFAGAANESVANQTGLLCGEDTRAIRDVLAVRCPVFAMVVDMELAEGFRELVARFPLANRQRRLGQSFPFVEDPNLQPDIIDSGVDWICLELFPSVTYRMMRVGRSQQDKKYLRANVRLYNFLLEMRTRRRHLARLLNLAVAQPGGEPTLLGGCYFASTGRDDPQAFIAAVFQRLLESQAFVAWTRDARDDEQRSHRRALAGFVGLGVLTLVFCVGAYFVIFAG